MSALESLVKDIADRLIRENGFTLEEVEKSLGSKCKTSSLWQRVYSEVKSFGLDTIAQVAATGKSRQQCGMSMVNVHAVDSWIDSDMSGRVLLRTIASTVLIAKIYEILDATPVESFAYGSGAAVIWMENGVPQFAYYVCEPDYVDVKVSKPLEDAIREGNISASEVADLPMNSRLPRFYFAR